VQLQSRSQLTSPKYDGHPKESPRAAFLLEGIRKKRHLGWRTEVAASLLRVLQTQNFIRACQGASLGDFPPTARQANKPRACQDQTRQSRTDDGAGDWGVDRAR